MQDNNKSRVLLVEDNRDDAELIANQLRNSDFEIVNVVLLADACEYLKVEDTDLILLDLHLPNGHGIEVVRRMRSLSGMIPIVVLTGDNDEKTAHLAIEEGVKGFMTKKNMDRVSLLSAMQIAIGARRAAIEVFGTSSDVMEEKLDRLERQIEQAAKIKVVI